jgi:hypothetical protein
MFQQQLQTQVQALRLLMQHQLLLPHQHHRLLLQLSHRHFSLHACTIAPAAAVVWLACSD